MEKWQKRARFHLKDEDSKYLSKARLEMQKDSNVKFLKNSWSLYVMFISYRLYSCLANGSADEFQRGEQLFRVRAVKDPLQIGENSAAPRLNIFKIPQTISAVIWPCLKTSFFGILDPVLHVFL